MEKEGKILFLLNKNDFNNLSFSYLLINALNGINNSHIDICITDISENIYYTLTEKKTDKAEEIIGFLLENLGNDKIFRVYKASDIKNIGNMLLLLGSIYNREMFYELGINKDRIIQNMIFYITKLMTIFSDNFSKVYTKEAKILNKLMFILKENGFLDNISYQDKKDIFIEIDEVINANILNYIPKINYQSTEEELKKIIYRLPTDKNNIDFLISFKKILKTNSSNIQENREGKYKFLKDNIINSIITDISKTNKSFNDKQIIDIINRSKKSINTNFDINFEQIKKTIKF
ncbi:MAG: hypothetical protein WC872_01530 [Candidatus Absconditabacterales bacterium]